MTLLVVIKELYSFPEDHVICATRPWTMHSDASVIPNTTSGSIAEIEAEFGKDYFLETHIAREVVEDWLSNFTIRPSDEKLCEVVIHYAENDAYPDL